MRKVLFGVCYTALNFTPFFLVLGMAFVATGLLPVSVLVAPAILIAVPAGAYLLCQRCPGCRKSIYSTDSLRQAGKLRSFPTHVFKDCPCCRRSLNDLY